MLCVCVCVFSGADSPRSSEPLPLAVAKEAKVSDMEDDQLGEEDLVFLDDKWVFSLDNIRVSQQVCKYLIFKRSVYITRIYHFVLFSGRREKMETRKKNWFCLKTVSSSPLWLLFRVVWRLPHITCISMMAVVRRKKQKKVENICDITLCLLFTVFQMVLSKCNHVCVFRNWVWFQEASVSP